MKILFIGNYYPFSFEETIIKNSVSSGLSFSSNHFNSKLIEGFLMNNMSIDILSCPIFGSFPSNTKIKKFSNHDLVNNNNITYCYYNNHRLKRQFSRAISIRKELVKLLKTNTYDAIIISELHLPFIKTIPLLKKRTTALVTLLVLDLPEYSYLGSRKRLLYNALKMINNRMIYKYTKQADSFIFLSKYMNTPLVNPFNKPHIIVETIIPKKTYCDAHNNIPVVTYTGTLHYSFGINTLLSAFNKSNGAFKLIIAGSGDAEDKIKQISKNNKMLEFKGVVPVADLEEIYNKTDVFVNPRSGYEVFSKYSFPSKIGEYLSYLKPVVSFDLPSFNDKIKEVLIIPKSESDIDLLKSITHCLQMTEKEKKNLSNKTQLFVSKYYPQSIANIITKELWKK